MQSKGDGILASTNGGIGIRPEVFDGQTVAWDTNANYGTIGRRTQETVQVPVPNDMDRLYDGNITFNRYGRQKN